MYRGSHHRARHATTSGDIGMMHGLCQAACYLCAILHSLHFSLHSLQIRLVVHEFRKLKLGVHKVYILMNGHIIRWWSVVHRTT